MYTSTARLPVSLSHYLVKGQSKLGKHSAVNESWMKNNKQKVLVPWLKKYKRFCTLDQVQQPLLELDSQTSL